ncbi:hypothetical protein PhCBS80983_g00241 [Powellomyces hirtus]|uniref:Uncharacterized protein n=1 Tax=Powellomyces hirtus TaxID=109895 RepID=A0A507EEJ7_9FUNG|nr:hypothetical protein PhCBS80983_g00241 [Powellomyces hirtus]
MATEQQQRTAKLDHEARHNQVLREGATSVAISAPLGLAAALLAQKHIKFFQRLSMPFKTFLVLMVPTATFFTVTDRAAMRWDREMSYKYSVTRKEDLAPVGPIIPHDEGISQMIHRYRYQIIGWGWLGTMGATLLYNYRRTDITRALKIINARMTAQTFALVGVAAIAGLAATAPETQKNDPYYDRIMRGN